MDAATEPVPSQEAHNPGKAEGPYEAPYQGRGERIAGFGTGLQQPHHLAVSDGNGRPADAGGTRDGASDEAAEAACPHGISARHCELFFRWLIAEHASQCRGVLRGGGPERDLHW